MAELISSQDIMFTSFEPKLKNRYTMNIEGIPAYMIKTANRPQITFDEVELQHLNIKRFEKYCLLCVFSLLYPDESNFYLK